MQTIMWQEGIGPKAVTVGSEDGAVHKTKTSVLGCPVGSAATATNICMDKRVVGDI